MKDFIPVSEPYLKGNESKYLEECIKSGWISSEGPFVREFEKKISDRVGRKHAIAVTNGTAALDASVEALGIKKGDEIIVPTFTIISCLHQIIRCGAKPVLVDSDPYTWNMDVSQIEQKITTRTKAIMAVHIYGLTVDVDPILFLAKKYNLFVIEDAAEAIGQTYKGKECGSFGHISIFSFYPNKNITTGEGGMIFTDNDDLAEKCRKLRNLYFDNSNRFVHQELGWNLRMTNMQASLGLAQLEQLDTILSKKRSLGKLYQELLSNIKGLQLPLIHTDFSTNVYWVFGILLKDLYRIDARQLREHLFNKGIGTRPFFYPMHLQPVFKKLDLFKNTTFPVSENLYEKGLYLPSSIGLKTIQIEKVCNELKTILNQYRK